MADLALVTADRVRLVESHEQESLLANVALTAGQVVAIDGTTGRWVLADGDTLAGTAEVFLVLRSVPAGGFVTGLKVGVVDGFDLTGLDYGDPLFPSANAGMLSDTAGTGVMAIPIGHVRPALGQQLGLPPDKLLQFRSPV